MGKIKEMESEMPEFDPETHKWDWEKKEVVALTPEELADIARRKRKADLEKRFASLIESNAFYVKAFGFRYEKFNGESHVINWKKEIAEWDRDNLDDFEQKVLKLEAAKKEMDDEAAKNKPLEDRRREYRKIDELLFEAIAEKQENKAEKMEEYLKLRNEIKARFPK